MIKIYSFSFILLFGCTTILALEQQQDSEAGSQEKEYTFFKGEKTMIKNPFELRDPFKEEMLKRATKKKNIGNNSVTEGNLFSNVPTVDSITSLDKIRVVGVLLGKDRRALIRLGSGAGASKDIIILKEGMKVGVDNVELKAILPGGVVFVEKIRNVYDQDEYLETVIPVSSE